MSIAIVHLSDIHYRKNWDENHGVVFESFFQDLQSQIDIIGCETLYLIISGDIVQSGSDITGFREFLQKFDGRLTSLGIPKECRVCVPGNHDLSQESIKKNEVDHKGVILQDLSESEFNDYATNPANLFVEKLFNYCQFEKEFTNNPLINKSITGGAVSISPDIEVYGLNTAFFSSAGIYDTVGEKKSFDEGRLCVDTRGLHAWNNSCGTKCKILVMHHPFEYLCPWAQKELKTLIAHEQIKLILSGHAHDQSVYHAVDNDKLTVQMSAPPLFSDKEDSLGYAIITFSSFNVKEIIYRQWTKYNTFVPGVNFANNETGKIQICGKYIVPKKCGVETTRDFVDEYLTKKLNDSLTIFSSQPKVWVEPIMSSRSELDREFDSNERVLVSDILADIRPAIIKAPPQFGLTCLAHYIVREAWRNDPRAICLYIDLQKLPQSQNGIRKSFNSELELIGCNIEDISCVVVDSLKFENRNLNKKLKVLYGIFKDVTFIIMQTIDNSYLVANSLDEDFFSEFDVYYLRSLSKNRVRSVVNSYNNERHIGDEDVVTTRLVSDLDVLNIHRTPLNCLTVLKVSEIDFDESPVNRTEMLRRVLFLLFNVDDLPKYKTRPDMKDCEYILGYFCELMIRNDSYFFSYNYFIKTLESFCKSRVMDLDVNVMFDILFSNHIIVPINDEFRFRFTYWVYYFAAQRMHQDTEFAEYIYSDMNYSRFPEIIEFYTGIDRSRDDALNVLTQDLKKINQLIQDGYGISDDINPYQFIQWKPTSAMLEQMQAEVRDGVSSSNLPTEIKDHYSDSNFDRTKPYSQEVRDLMNDNSLVTLLFSLTAASRALRNSDYVTPDVKRNLLREILSGWKQLTKVLLVVVPLLAERETAFFDGIVFHLVDDFGETPEKRLRTILMSIPFNVVSRYKDDLFSPKMGPLLREQFDSEDDVIKKHELALTLIKQRPRGWDKTLTKYIQSISKNSFYLYDIMAILRGQYEYSYSGTDELHRIEYMIKMCVAKHSYGTKKPGSKVINKISDDCLPNRDVPKDEC